MIESTEGKCLDGVNINNLNIYLINLKASMGNLTKKRGTKYLGSQIWESQMPVFFSPRCAISPTENTNNKNFIIYSCAVYLFSQSNLSFSSTRSTASCFFDHAPIPNANFKHWQTKLF